MSRVLSTRNLIIGVGVIACVTILALVLAVLAQGRAAKASEDAAAAQAAAARVAVDQAAQADRQAQLLRDSICGTFVAISREPITVRTTPLGRTISRETGKGAQVARCPGAPAP